MMTKKIISVTTSTTILGWTARHCKEVDDDYAAVTDDDAGNGGDDDDNDDDDDSGDDGDDDYNGGVDFEYYYGDGDDVNDEDCLDLSFINHFGAKLTLLIYESQLNDWFQM